MLLIHQAGAVKVGEVVRYTLTYTPLNDRILPSPTQLHVKVKNTSAIPLRAAYLHGPYTLHVSTYPSTFNPNQKLENGEKYGYPDFEPNLKAAGHWSSKLTVPDHIRSAGGKINTVLNEDGSPQSVTWIIEIASQIIFSNSASVNYELLVARDERSLDMGFAALASKGHGEPGMVQDFRTNQLSSEERRHGRPKGVYSKAVELIVEDTVALWNKPALPRWEGHVQPTQTVKTESSDKKPDLHDEQTKPDEGQKGPIRKRKKKKLHLVILTHGLHSNVGADLLYLKESIDATAKAARADAKERNAALRKGSRKKSSAQVNTEPGSTAETKIQVSSTAPLSGGQDELSDHEENEYEGDSDDDEQVIVRGFSGNAVKTERGIQYLGKRLAKFILTTTYPDQPYLPPSKSISRSFSITAKIGSQSSISNQSSSFHEPSLSSDQMPYTFTKISFIGHSLGGLIQTYAIGYIHKHSPEFFKQIKPENFVAMAAPFLGLSNENPVYVKFALDFGLVGRTGRDLGLTWRAPTIARSGWSAMVAGLGPAEKQKKEEDPRAKPLLRVLPTGPAHQVLKMFTNRTVYSNVVNDGIVPLRTSCLLFLDWRGLERVENARRENGLITTMAQFGWNELTGANASAAASLRPSSGKADEGSHSPSNSRTSSPLPVRPADSEAKHFSDDKPGNTNAIDALSVSPHYSPKQSDVEPTSVVAVSSDMDHVSTNSTSTEAADGTFSDIFKFFRSSTPKSNESSKSGKHVKVSKTYRRAQTIRMTDGKSDSDKTSPDPDSPSWRPQTVRGESFEAPPPKTSFFEAAGDILNPPLPSRSWLVDPSSRSRTIFHDRIYHSRDIPPPPPKRPLFSRSFSGENPRRSSTGSTTSQGSRASSVDTAGGGSGGGGSSGMKIEEKIARAYHRDLAWRKVLVRLEPDAHNNMIVRRMFANAYGWDVVKHLCDTHFGGSYASVTPDEKESSEDRVASASDGVSVDGEEVVGQTRSEVPPGSLQRTESERKEAIDDVHELKSLRSGSASLASNPSMHRWEREDSVGWDEAVFDGEDADDTDDEAEGPFATFQKFWSLAPRDNRKEDRRSWPGQLNTQLDGTKGGKLAEPKIADALTRSPLPMDSHRGLGVVGSEVLRAGQEEDAKIDAITAEEARPDNLDDSDDGKQVASSTELGLRRSVEEQIGGPKSPEILTRASVKK